MMIITKFVLTGISIIITCKLRKGLKLPELNRFIKVISIPSSHLIPIFQQYYIIQTLSKIDQNKRNLFLISLIIQELLSNQVISFIFSLLIKIGIYFEKQYTYFHLFINKRTRNLTLMLISFLISKRLLSIIKIDNQLLQISKNNIISFGFHLVDNLKIQTQFLSLMYSIIVIYQLKLLNTILDETINLSNHQVHSQKCNTPQISTQEFNNLSNVNQSLANDDSDSDTKITI